MFRGMATIRLQASGLEAAVAWYADVLGAQPYFRVPGYTEFRVGDTQDEIGIMQTDAVVTGGQVTYWHVDDLDADLARLIERGATLHEARRDMPNGFAFASVVDPFGNLVGVMTNPHWLEMSARQAR